MIDIFDSFRMAWTAGSLISNEEVSEQIEQHERFRGLATVGLTNPPGKRCVISRNGLMERGCRRSHSAMVFVEFAP